MSPADDNGTGPRPNLNDDGWELESAEERQRQFPELALPAADQRAQLRVGDLAKLLFLIDATAQTGYVECERMWVRVSHVFDGGYAGNLESSPLTRPVLEPGSEVRFAPLHIVEIRRAGTQ